MTLRSPLHLKRPGPHTRAVTLSELVVSMAIMTILLGAIASTLVLSARALDPAADQVEAADEARDAVDRLAAELNTAVSVSERSSAAIMFSVPDRDNDGTPETIRYAWSAKAADPLTRQFNGGAALSVINDVQSLTLEYQTRTVGTPPPEPSGTRGPVTLLASHDDAVGGSFNALQVKYADWAAQYVKPVLSINAVAWCVTRADLRLRVTGKTAGLVRVLLTEADGSGVPTTRVLAEQFVAESSLGSGYQWITVSFPRPPLISPDRGVCIVVGGTGADAKDAEIEYEQDGTLMPTGTHWITSLDASVTWSAPNDTQDMRFRLYGTVTTN